MVKKMTGYGWHYFVKSEWPVITKVGKRMTFHSAEYLQRITPLTEEVMARGIAFQSKHADPEFLPAEKSTLVC